MIILFSISCNEEKIIPINLVPKPVHFVQKTGSFTLYKNSSIFLINKSPRIIELVEFNLKIVKCNFRLSDE